MGSVSNMFTLYTAISCLLSAGLAVVKAEEDLSEVSDPRLFFTNVTSSLLPVNLTLAAYGAAVILGGSVLGLVLYFLATQTRPRYTGGYYDNFYNQHGHGHQHGHHHFVDRMDQARSFDILGLIGNALNMCQDTNQKQGEEYFAYQ